MMPPLQLISDQIALGRPLPFGVRDQSGKLLLARGHLITDAHQLAELLMRGAYVDPIECEFFNHLRRDKIEAKQLTTFDLWEQSIWQLERLLLSIDHEPNFAQRCDDFAVRLMHLIDRDPDVAIYLSVRKDERRLSHYGLMHPLHCALVCHLMGKRSGWSVDRIRTLVKAALTMNLAIVELQSRYAVYGRLSEEQMAEIRRHPAQAVERLKAAGVSDAHWLQIVIEHHEHLGGGGYPNNLQEVLEDSNVLRLADVFMAKISPRTSRPAMSIQEAERQMYKESADNAIAAAIIKEYGVYPPGNFVRLASGELGVVIRRGASALTPVVAAVTDKLGLPVVRIKQRDTAQPQYAIKAIEPNSGLALRLSPERLYGMAE